MPWWWRRTPRQGSWIHILCREYTFGSAQPLCVLFIIYTCFCRMTFLAKMLYLKWFCIQDCVAVIYMWCGRQKEYVFFIFIWGWDVTDDLPAKVEILCYSVNTDEKAMWRPCFFKLGLVPGLCVILYICFGLAEILSRFLWYIYTAYLSWTVKYG